MGTVVDLEEYKRSKDRPLTDTELRKHINDAPGISWEEANRFSGDLDGLKRYLKNRDKES